MQEIYQKAKPDVSIVVPVYNEEENIELLYKSLKRVVETLGRNTEIIFVDDGSVDRTFDILSRLKSTDDRLKVIRFTRNFGQTAAMSAGFNFATGDVVITMDGDLQNDPRDIPSLLKKIDEGHDVVSGWRFNRQDKFISRKIPSVVANWIISLITGVKLHDSGCSLKAYRSQVIKNLRLYGEMHRFIPALASAMGARVTEVQVNHSARRFGRSKYGLSRIIRVVLDLMTVKFLLSFITRPLQIFGLWGIAFSGIGLLICLYLTVLRLFFGEELGERPLLMLGVMLLVLGVQFIGFGLIGEMQTRTYYEVQNKPTYVIRDLLE